MARIRTVKPELFRHELLHEIELETGLPVRLSFVGLFCVCDKEGRFRWRPKQLKLDILPYDNLDFSRVLDALATRGLLVKYTCAGEFYGCIPTFTRHQHINNRESDSILPPPPKCEANEIIKMAEDVENTRDSGSSNDACSTREARVEHGAEGEREREREREKEKEKENNPHTPQKGDGDLKKNKRLKFDPKKEKPDFVSDELWTDFIEHRSAIKKPLTATSTKHIRNKLADAVDQGHDADNMLSESIANGWQGVFAPKTNKKRSNQTDFDKVDYTVGLGAQNEDGSYQF